MTEPYYRTESSRVLAGPIQGQARVTGGRRTMWETSPGRIARQQRFVLEEAPTSGRGTARGPTHLTVQVRTGVGMHEIGGRSQGGMWHEIQRDHDDLIAIGAMGGREGFAYTWVQIVTTDPERISDRSGSTRVEDIGRDGELPTPEHGFQYQGRRWEVDMNPGEDSPSYASVGLDLRPSGYSRGEIIYDAPTHAVAITGWMERHREARRVERTTRFETYLFEVPGREFLPRLRPVVAVLWQRQQTFEAPTPGAQIQESASYYVPLIWPMPAWPPGMRSVIWRAFGGR